MSKFIDLDGLRHYNEKIQEQLGNLATSQQSLLYKHNISLNGTNSNGQQITARVVGLSRSNVVASSYGQVINMITGAVDYPVNGYVFSNDNTLLGTIVYMDYNMGNYFEFTVVTNTGVEVIELPVADLTIGDTLTLVE